MIFSICNFHFGGPKNDVTFHCKKSVVDFFTIKMTGSIQHGSSVLFVTVAEPHDHITVSDYIDMRVRSNTFLASVKGRFGRIRNWRIKKADKARL
jgi:hypothetical protein